MLGHRRTRCASIMPALGQHLLLADVFCVIRSRSHTGFFRQSIPFIYTISIFMGYAITDISAVMALRPLRFMGGGGGSWLSEISDF